MACGGSPVMSSSYRRTRPEVGRSTPVRQLNRVDFPAPFGPMTARISPGATASETWLRAVRPPNCTVRPSVRRIAGEAVPGPGRGAATPRASVTPAALGELAAGWEDRLL